jgi:hypothetical protein
MAERGCLDIIKSGTKEWNLWRDANIRVSPDLSFASLPLAKLRGGNFVSTNLTGAILVGADLRETTFNRDARLDGADLRGADLRRAAILLGANLRGADLRGADLRQAVLEANLTEALLDGADLRGSDFRGAELLGASLKSALFSHKTLWPSEYDPLSEGAILLQTRSELVRETELPNDDFTVTFSPELSPTQMRTTLAALADYFRSCGGVGFKIDFEVRPAVFKRLHV